VLVKASSHSGWLCEFDVPGIHFRHQ